MKISEVLKLYKEKGLPEREALILISKVLERSKEFVISHDELECPEQAIELLEKRLTGYPLQYILGEVEFFGRKFYIEEGVLIPRWETEGLVEIAIDLIRKNGIKKVLEIGVGSGVILITLALETGVECYGTDINPKAIKVTRKNSQMYNVNCELKLGEYAEPFIEEFDEIELIVSNPPYVRADAVLPIEVQYEPPDALFAGKDGLDFYKKFFERYNIQGKIVVMEIGEDQGEALRKLTGGEILKDLAGKDRYLVVIGN